MVAHNKGKRFCYKCRHYVYPHDYNEFLDMCGWCEDRKADFNGMISEMVVEMMIQDVEADEDRKDEK